MFKIHILGTQNFYLSLSYLREKLEERKREKRRMSELKRRRKGKKIKKDYEYKR
jgi:hypothetical protein